MSRPDAIQRFHEGQCIPAIPLVLDDHRQFDEAAQRKLIRYYLDAGVGGIAVGVHTTQFAIRDPEHQLFDRVLQTTIEEMERFEEQNQETLIRVAGVCGETEQAMEEAQLALDLGFDAVLLSIGGLGDRDEPYLIERTEQVSAILPTIAFSMQLAVGGRYFSQDYWQALFAMPGVIGAKAAPFNRYETINIARAAAFASRSTELTLYTGNDDNIIVDLLTPFTFKSAEGEERTIYIKGGLLGHWSVWTGGAVTLFNQLKEIRESGATEIPLQWLTVAAQLTEANGAVFDWSHQFAGCIPGVHLVLCDDGYMQNILTLDPNETLTEGQAKLIRKAKRDYPDLCRT